MTFFVGVLTPKNSQKRNFIFEIELQKSIKQIFKDEILKKIKIDKKNDRFEKKY